MFNKLKDFINQKTLFGEIMRFCITGGVATIVDFLIMALTEYILEPTLYTSIFDVFFGEVEPQVYVAVIGTGIGFVCGLVVNYIMSVLFVFNDKGNSKTVGGFVIFALLSGGGLLIHEVGMLLIFGKFGLNEWLTKILLTLVVLVYNYITRKVFIFNKGKGDK